jgi:hypothetical protein
MKKPFGRLFGRPASGAAAGQPPLTIDPGKILYSMATISNDGPPIEPMREPLADTDLALHEDEWRQIEFFPSSRLPGIEGALVELKAFAAEHRQGSSGWRRIYIRDMGLEPVVVGPMAVELLADQLGAASGPGPVIVGGADHILGRVDQGFSLDLGSGAALYGYGDDAGIRVLGANLAHGGDHHRLSEAFAELNARSQLILVDWRSQVVLVSTTHEGTLSVWQP